MPISRRLLLQTGLAAGALSTIATTPAAAADEFAALRTRWSDLATGGAIDPTDPAYADALGKLTRQAQGFLDTLTPDADALWPDLPLSPTSGNFSLSYNRLKSIALARATPGTTLNQDPAAVLASALDFLNERAYNESLPETGNWWFWEIGAPRALLDTCVLAYDILSDTQRAAYLRAVDRFVPDPNRRTNSPSVRETGANRVDKALIVALRGLVGSDAAKVAAARDALSDVAEAGKNSVFTYVTSGDGFYRDGSFVQHGNLAYVGTYGNVALGGIANLLALLGGSTWEITDPNRAVVLDAVAASFAPFVVNGLMMDAVSGRAISREKAGDHRNGHATTSTVLLLASGVAAPYAADYRALAKGWLTRDRLNDYLPSASIPDLARAKAVLADPAVPAAPAKPGHFQFHHQDRVVHRRPGWTFAIAMSSKRMARYEWGNGENLRGWYVGDGMTYLYNDDHSQFFDAFWPTVDAQRLPGTTVSAKPRQPHAGTAGTGTIAAYAEWVGGASYRNTIGAVGMHLINHDKSLQAKKSWFCLPDAIVALGAGISGTDGFPVETVVENRNLHADGAARLLVDGRTGANTQYADPRWAHLEGVGGYVFPNGGRLRAHREDRTGSWSEINVGNDTGGSTTPHTRRYQSLVLEHDRDAYAYILLPGATPAQTARHCGVTIVANIAAVQAIRSGQVTMANFWTPATAAGITSDGPASVVVGRENRTLTVAVADPSRTATTVRITIDRRAGAVLTADPSVTVVETGGRLVLEIAVGGSRGATHTASFRDR
ncbi:polysaccharide lyase 8 family protein [Kribbella sandramycini]|uniref:Hyaluronate lyase n=1 Tax=Kribbella sandramycini TaxID=60450 RepID=A0A7Y4KVF1_9ACTN|nr:polysaccharide lyase 8 family protein [Kribbella sandramycini]MBB6568063.1 hyaluronate lyase [Kribbella sandramycini]NOL39343.1 polysaccharide lyase 8 family protein [Kribbella sandramycini]